MATVAHGLEQGGLLLPNNLVRDVGDNRGHPLLEKGTFEQLHRNEIIETRPHILHFGGFQIHKEHVHMLRVVNISPSSLRLAIIAPQTPHFRISYDKKGLLAPGMSEEIQVVFTPHEWRYYYDTIKIFCGELAENLLVPIHAYPSANDIFLPRIVDFGKVAIGTSRTKVIPLSCKIPIQFEFEIVVLEAHPDFEVTPLLGVIPPDGTTNVAVTFLPTKHRTARTELQFNISQFDFEPVTVTVVGSCTPDLSRDEVLGSGVHEMDEKAASVKQAKLKEKVETLKSTRDRNAIEVKLPRHAVESERIVDGVKMKPPFSQQSTNFVLNQTAGKLPLKDLSSFIREQRDAAERRRRRAEAMGGAANAGEENEDQDDRQALELRFEMQYREVEKYDKEKELKGVVAVGEDTLTEAEVAREIEARRKRQARLLDSRMKEDAERSKTATSNKRVAVPMSFRPGARPSWDEYANDTFSMRLQVIDRFVRAGSKALMQVRARKRCDRLREAMRQAGVTDKASCVAWVDAENKTAAAGGRGTQTSSGDGHGAVDDEVVRILKDFVLPLQVPIAQSSMDAEERKPVVVQPLNNFEEFQEVDIRVRLDFKVLQYEKYEVPASAAYMRPNERKPLHAALEELSVRGQRGDIFDGAEEPLTMPKSCLRAPLHDPMDLLVPSTACRSYVGFPEYVECDFEYRLARPVPLRKTPQEEPLLPENLACLETPWLGQWRRAREIQDPFKLFDPFPACLAEAGGSFGPRIGADAGGERLSFLPVGGHARDIPSDTDSDEREDFELPWKLEPAESVAACRRMSGPLESELWLKTAQAEQQLDERFSASNCAIRGRLREFNAHLDHANKIYLG